VAGQGGVVKPLVIRAHLLEGFVTRHAIHLDGLLTAAIAMRDNWGLPPMSLAEVRAADLPLARSECGRFWLASAGVCRARVVETRHKNRRAPWVEYARLGSAKIRRVQISAGENKSHRETYELTIPDGGTIEWWCIGDADGVRALLAYTRYLGRFRNTGKGQVAEWAVSECEPWGDGFPVMRDGAALRNLPSDSPHAPLRRCEPPYFLKEGMVPCLVP